jgi:hypothetical protein
MFRDNPSLGFLFGGVWKLGFVYVNPEELV